MQLWLETFLGVVEDMLEHWRGFQSDFFFFYFICFYLFFLLLLFDLFDLFLSVSICFYLFLSVFICFITIYHNSKCFCIYRLERSKVDGLDEWMDFWTHLYYNWGVAYSWKLLYWERQTTAQRDTVAGEMFARLVASKTTRTPGLRAWHSPDSKQSTCSRIVGSRRRRRWWWGPGSCRAACWSSPPSPCREGRQTPTSAGNHLGRRKTPC